MPSRSKKSKSSTAHIILIRSRADLAEVIKSMTFEDLVSVGNDMSEMIKGAYKKDTGLGVAEILSDWAHCQ